MGYYTDYTLSWEFDGTDADIRPSDLDEQIVKAFGELDYWNGGGFDSWGGSIWANAKWYDHMDDMFVLSKKFPSVLFQLHGNGEEDDDLWNDYWKDGHFQTCRAVIPPYNKKLMMTYEPQKGGKLWEELFGSQEIRTLNG